MKYLYKRKYYCISGMTSLVGMLSLLIVVLSGCSKQKNNWSDSGKNGEMGETYKTTKDVIEEMNNNDWEDTVLFNKVYDRYINESVSLSEADRVSLNSKLLQTYADQLVRTANHILDSDCSPRHNTLNAAIQEYDNRDFNGYLPEGTQEMKDKYAKHNEQLKFSVSDSYSVPLKTFLDSYDGSYDSKVRAEAQKIRATNPTCTAIKQKVSEAHVNEVLAQRKQNYYAALASKFCRSTDPNRGKYNRLQSILGNAKNSAALISKIEAHWDDLHNKKTAEIY